MDISEQEEIFVTEPEQEITTKKVWEPPILVAITSSDIQGGTNGGAEGTSAVGLWSS